MNRNVDTIENALYNLAEKLGVTLPADGNIADKINYIAAVYTPTKLPEFDPETDEGKILGIEDGELAWVTAE